MIEKVITQHQMEKLSDQGLVQYLPFGGQADYLAIVSGHPYVHNELYDNYCVVLAGKETTEAKQYGHH